MNSLRMVGVAGIESVPLEEQGGIRTGALQIYAIEQDAAGNVLEQVDQRMNLRLNEQEYRAYLKSGILFRGMVPLKPGATVLRVLVQDAGTAQVGCVIVPLEKVK